MKILEIFPEMLVVSKPAGMLSVPARNADQHPAPVLSHILRERFDCVLPVHRLDRSTSGVMIFARTESMQRQLSAQFEKHLVEKEYRFLAWVKEEIHLSPSYLCDVPIDGKSSKTVFKILKENQKAIYGQAIPRTGRFHQIRIHARSLGFPLLGDRKYGGKQRLEMPNGTVVEISRTQLHAFRLRIQGLGSWEDPEPKDFLQLRECLGLENG